MADIGVDFAGDQRFQASARNPAIAKPMISKRRPPALTTFSVADISVGCDLPGGEYSCARGIEKSMFIHFLCEFKYDFGTGNSFNGQFRDSGDIFSEII